MRTKCAARIRAMALVVAAIASVGCGDSDLPTPVILNINNSTDPSSPIGLAIEINGSGFLDAPGKVRFAEAATGIQVDVTPDPRGWSDTGIVVVVPPGNGTNQFTVPGTVVVSVETDGGTSNGVDLDLIETLTFDVNNVTWATTTALPTPLAGLRAASIPVDDTNAFVVVAGGFDGSANVTTVLSNTLNPDGQVGADWTTISTTPLPAPRAHHGLVVAHPGNSLVSEGSRFIYVIAGQENSTDSPGGTATVFRASVDVNDGSVGPWTELNTPLPETLVGPAVTLFNGHIYVVGGLRTNSIPSEMVYSAEVQSDGALSEWTTSPNPYPLGLSFATAFGFGGKLYVLSGDIQVSTNPNEQGAAGIKDANFATARNGEVGPWAATEQTIKQRKKHITWNAFGQVIEAEGVYQGSPGSLELERSVIKPDSTLAPWNGITSTANQIFANVYNAGALLSPLQSPTSKPRFLLLGGQAFSATPPGALSDTVYYNNAP